MMQMRSRKTNRIADIAQKNPVAKEMLLMRLIKDLITYVSISTSSKAINVLIN